MPRTARLQLPDVPLHVVQRGHNRSPTFVDCSDYERYLELLGNASPQTRCAIHAYVLMPNHVHLLLTPSTTGGASDLMSAVNQRYVQYVNRKRRRTGSLWEGRFHSSLVDSETYLLVCQRYIELNPVRAGMVEYPGQYRWSSYRANAEGATCGIVSPHPLLNALGRGEDDRRRNYVALFREPLSAIQLERIRRSARLGRPLGGEVFIAVMNGHFGARATPAPQGRPRKQDESGQGEKPF